VGNRSTQTLTDVTTLQLVFLLSGEHLGRRRLGWRMEQRAASFLMAELLSYRMGEGLRAEHRMATSRLGGLLPTRRPQDCQRGYYSR